jgi:hypothetical protein
MKPDEFLVEAAKLYLEKNEEYGSAYKQMGPIYTSMFPNGVHLNSAADFERFCMLVGVVSKIYRYGKRFLEGGHEDSLQDLAVYASMLAELDEPCQ